MASNKDLSENQHFLPITANGEPDWQYMEDYMKKRLNEAELAVSQLQSAV